jgi:hypothetical protein
MDWLPYQQKSPIETPRPYLVVGLRYQGNSVPVLAVVDSGADYSSFNIAHARKLGFNPGLARQIDAMGPEGQPFKCWHAKDLGLEMEIGNKSYPLRGILIDSDTDVLGRGDFFNHFEVIFRERDKHFALTSLDVE